MTTKVVDFLNESGGSNFTETAPRPPTYGEENELQSNGGNSTKSSNSRKSHGSSKSHSSSRSGTSIKGEHLHSPATTPRKSNLEGPKLLDTMTGVTHNSLCECEDGENAAPLGFEPEGSAASSPPYSENGTPPHLKWAENLIHLLDDSEGVMLFRDFMEHELTGGSEELQFWFACQGFKKRKISSADSLDHTVTDIQKAIYKRYVRSEKVKCISKTVKKEIAAKISNKHVDPCIFDAAQSEVENSMKNETYPAFLRSHYYLEYVQNYVDSPKSSHSSSSNTARNVPHTLPVVLEDKEMNSEDFNSSVPLPVIRKATASSKKTEAEVTLRHTETITGSPLYCPRPSYYPAHVSYAPVSAQDSELQSLSSDAHTDDTVSLTDGSLDGYPHRLAAKKHHRKAVMKTLASHNREVRTGLHTQIIPRTEHPPKDMNLAATDPTMFAGLVIEKLNKLLEARENIVKVEEKLRSIGGGEGDKSEIEYKLLTTFAKPNTSATFIPLSSAMEEENAESILDQHCSRIWESSNHHSPSYSPIGPHSPPHRSPDRHKDVRKRIGVAATLIPPSNAYTARNSHRKRDAVSYEADERNLIMFGTETHRHIHHHHHHHHTSRDSSFKKAHVELESQTCGLSSWRGENMQNLPADFAGGECSGRGRTSTRKGAGSSARKSSDTGSNIDSGISVMDSVKVLPSWNHPTSEKVMKWMLDSETVQEVSLSVQDTDKNSSSHRRSHRLNQSASSAQQTRSSSKSKGTVRSLSVERGGGALSAWSGAVPIMPSQPIVQDPSMPLLTPPNPTTQLEEAKRRLETQSRTTGATNSSSLKSKSFTDVPPKDKTRPSPGGPPMTAASHNRALPTSRTFNTQLESSSINQSFDSSRLSQRMPSTLQPSVQSCPNDTIIGIYMGQEPIPYRHQLPSRTITLAQIKTLVTKRGVFKYYFKRHSDEFGDGAGAVFEEISDDSTIVPMFQGKIVVKVEKLDL